MKQKLKLLLAYFRSFKTDVLDTYINFDYNYLEQWEQKFTTKEGKTIEPPEFIIRIFEDLFNLYKKDFHRENDYEEDEYWTLLVYVYPKQNRINFQSECKVVTEYPYSKTYNLNYNIMNFNELVNDIFENEITDTDEFEFDFVGQYDEVDIDISNSIEEETNFIELADDLMTFIDGRWWSESYGAYGTIKVKKGEYVTIEYVQKSGDYEMTEMNINVTPDNVI